MSKNEEDKSCHNCSRHLNKGRYGCHWRTEIAMQEDESPCLNWKEYKDE